MTIKAISLADIAIADGVAISHQAYLLKHSNGLSDSFDWPRSPSGDWSTLFTNLWVRALKKCFIEPFDIPSSRTLLHVAQLGGWKDHLLLTNGSVFTLTLRIEFFAGLSGVGIPMFIQQEESIISQRSHLKQDQPLPQS